MTRASMRLRSRDDDVLGWAAIGGAAVVVVLACLLPAVHLRIDAFVGAGAAQRTFRYGRDVTFAGDLRPLGLAPLAAGLLLLAAAAFAILRGGRTWLVLGAFAVALGLGWFALQTSERLGREGHAVRDYKGLHGVLQPALHDLQAEARRSPEAQDAVWTLSGSESAAASENDYSADGLVGWTLLSGAAVVLLWLTGYRVACLRFGARASILAVAVASVATSVWLALRGLSRSS